MEGSEKADDESSRLRHIKMLTLSHCFPTDCDFVKGTLSFICYLGILSSKSYMHALFSVQKKHVMHINEIWNAMHR